MGSKQTKKKNKNNLKENDIYSDPVTKGYFKDLQLIFIHNFLENDNLISNMKYCLDEKNFDQILEDGNPNDFQNEQEAIVYETGDFVYWLDYLYQYLEEERNKYEMENLSNVKNIMANMKKNKMKFKMAIDQHLAKNQNIDDN